MDISDRMATEICSRMEFDELHGVPDAMYKPFTPWIAYSTAVVARCVEADPEILKLYLQTEQAALNEYINLARLIKEE